MYEKEKGMQDLSLESAREVVDQEQHLVRDLIARYAATGHHDALATLAALLAAARATVTCWHPVTTGTASEPPCSRCDDCLTPGHHWLIDEGQPQQTSPCTYTCKHCSARATTCPGCDGEYEGLSPDAWCPVCHGLGVIAVTATT